MKVLVTYVALSFLPMIVMILEEESPYEYIENEVPALKNVTFGANVAYIPRTWKLQLIVWIFFVILTLGIIIPSWWVVEMYKTNQHLKEQLSTTTFNMHRMLLISAAIEHFTVVVIIDIPLEILIVSLSISYPYASHVVYFSVIGMSFQTTVSAIFQCIFIKPFRRGVMDLVLLRFLRKSNIEPLFVSVTH